MLSFQHSPPLGCTVVSFALERFSKCLPSSSHHLSPSTHNSIEEPIDSSALGGVADIQPLQARLLTVARPTVTSNEKQPRWIHISTPPELVLVLVIPRTSVAGKPIVSPASLVPITLSSEAPFSNISEARSHLFVQSGTENYESIDLDPTSLRVSKLKGLVKGSMIGFRYTHIPLGQPSSSTAAVSEVRKCQVKFKSSAECAQCATILSSFFDCRGVRAGSTATATATSSAPALSSSDASICIGGTGYLSQDTVDISTCRAVSAQSILALDSSGVRADGTSSQILISSSSSSSSSQEFSSTLPLTITPRFGTQPMPVLSSTSLIISPSSSLPDHYSLASTTRGVGAAPAATTLIPASTAATAAILAEDSGARSSLEPLLSMSESRLEAEIYKILQDPTFPELLLKVEHAMRG